MGRRGGLIALSGARWFGALRRNRHERRTSTLKCHPPVAFSQSLRRDQVARGASPSSPRRESRVVTRKPPKTNGGASADRLNLHPRCRRGDRRVVSAYRKREQIEARTRLIQRFDSALAPWHDAQILIAAAVPCPRSTGGMPTTLMPAE